MRNVISMTSKGTFTLPVKIRESMGLRKKGDRLVITFDPETKTAEISKPQDFQELQKITSKYVTRGKKPLLNVDEFYQANRGKRP